VLYVIIIFSHKCFFKCFLSSMGLVPSICLVYHTDSISHSLCSIPDICFQQPQKQAKTASQSTTSSRTANQVDTGSNRVAPSGEKSPDMPKKVRISTSDRRQVCNVMANRVGLKTCYAVYLAILGSYLLCCADVLLLLLLLLLLIIIYNLYSILYTCLLKRQMYLYYMVISSYIELISLL